MDKTSDGACCVFITFNASSEKITCCSPFLSLKCYKPLQLCVDFRQYYKLYCVGGHSKGYVCVCVSLCGCMRRFGGFLSVKTAFSGGISLSQQKLSRGKQARQNTRIKRGVCACVSKCVYFTSLPAVFNFLD